MTAHQANQIATQSRPRLVAEALDRIRTQIHKTAMDGRFYLKLETEGIQFWTADVRPQLVKDGFTVTDGGQDRVMIGWRSA